MSKGRVNKQTMVEETSQREKKQIEQHVSPFPQKLME
jgi:hypothetical protein